MIKVPAGVTTKLEGCTLTLKGPKGEVKYTFPKSVKLIVQADSLDATGPIAMQNTSLAHMRNLVHGVTAGYSQKLKVIFAHFPMSLETKGTKFMIKNFIGEKQPRIANIIGTTKIEVKGQDLTISGCSKEHVGQTIANIRSATKIRNRDSRVFQDGIYPVNE